MALELDYFTILMAGGGAVVLNGAVSSFFTGRGETFTNMLAVVAGNATREAARNHILMATANSRQSLCF